MIRRHPTMLAALMLCALPSREPTPEEQRERTLKKLRTDLAREGESPEEVARITAALDLEAMEIAGGSIRDWGRAFGQALRRWRAVRDAEQALSDIPPKRLREILAYEVPRSEQRSSEPRIHFDEWTDVTWNPVIGCAKVSAGCKNCYAEEMAARVVSMQAAAGKRSVYLQVVDNRRWNRRAVFLPERLGEPLRWRKPRRVFVNSMSDLFHEDITFEQIAAVFGVMAATPRHTFQVLTKRPARMLEWFASVRGSCPDSDVLHSASMLMPDSSPLYRALERSSLTSYASRWPLPNVHLGVSVEDQAAADERIPLLLQCPAALRFLSVEPLLERVSLLRWTCGEHGRRHLGAPPGIGWVIVGGESGPGARPCGVDWIRSVVEQCRSAGVPVFVKQLGARPTFPLHTIDGLPADHLRMTKRDGGRWHLVDMRDRKGADPSEWPDDLRVQEFPR